MPFRTIWEPNPSDKSLPVLKEEELPAGVREFLPGFSDRHRTKSGVVDDEYKSFHYCPRCGGWIPGDYYTYGVNNLDTRHLAGRSGTSYACRRCGDEVDFNGIMS